MIKFKEYFKESIEPKEPDYKSYKDDYNKKIKYEFTTKLGNKVRVELEPLPDNKYYGIEIVFFVNNDISAFNKNNTDRDVEILSGVLYIILHHIATHNINEVTIHSIGDEDSEKNTSKPRKEFIETKNEIKNILFNMFNINNDKGLFKNVGSINKILLSLSISKKIEDNLIESLKDIDMSKEVYNKIIEHIMLYNRLVLDNRHIFNKRASIYYQLIRRYIGNEWDIQIKYGSEFNLKKHNY